MNSDENPSPLSQPTRNTCSHCGFGWNENTPFCPRCGAAQTPAKRRPLDAVAKVGLGCGLIIFGGVGTCFSYIGLNRVFDNTLLNSFTFIGVACLGLTLFLTFLLVRGGK